MATVPEPKAAAAPDKPEIGTAIAVHLARQTLSIALNAIKDRDADTRATVAKHVAQARYDGCDTD